MIGVGAGGSGVGELGNGTDGSEMIRGGSSDGIWVDCTEEYFREIVGFLSKADGMDLDHVSIQFAGLAVQGAWWEGGRHTGCVTT